MCTKQVINQPSKSITMHHYLFVNHLTTMTSHYQRSLTFLVFVIVLFLIGFSVVASVFCAGQYFNMSTRSTATWDTHPNRTAQIRCWISPGMADTNDQIDSDSEWWTRPCLHCVLCAAAQPLTSHDPQPLSASISHHSPAFIVTSITHG